MIKRHIATYPLYVYSQFYALLHINKAIVVYWEYLKSKDGRIKSLIRITEKKVFMINLS